MSDKRYYSMRLRYLMPIRSIVLSVFAFCCVTITASPVNDKSSVKTNFISGNFLVKLKQNVDRSFIKASLSVDDKFQPLSQIKFDSKLSHTQHWQRWHKFIGSKDSRMEDVINKIGKGNIEHIEPEMYLEFFTIPSDSLFSHQWYLRNTGQQYIGIKRIQGSFNDSLVLKQGITGKDIGIEQLYTSPPPQTTRVVIAIVDSGIDLLHPDLQGKFWVNRDEFPGNNLDDDHNGFIDDTLGYDVSGDSLAFFGIEGDNDPTDEVGHGTHVAGIAAAAINSIGVAGVSQNSEIMAVKIRPNATNAIGASGIIYAVANGADVINISWGTPYESAILREALDFARANGVFVAIAAGNSGNSEKFYPAAFDSAFAVAAGNSSGYLTSFSTIGPAIDIVAPGEDILSLRASGTDMYAAIGEPNVRIVGENDEYYLSDGTSMAAPIVAGTAALLWSVRPDISLNELEDALRMGAIDMLDPYNTGDSLPDYDTLSGYGYLNVLGAYNQISGSGISFVEPIAYSRYESSLDVKVSPINGYSGGWILERATDQLLSSWEILATSNNIPLDSIIYSFSQSDSSGLFVLRLTDDNNRYSDVRFSFIASDTVEFHAPKSGDEYSFSIPIVISSFGTNYDSLQISFSSATTPSEVITKTTAEYFDSTIITWNASGLPTDDYTIELLGYFNQSTIFDTVTIKLISAFTEGWPQTLPGRGSYSAAVADLENDGIKEIIVGTTFGLNVFTADGTPKAGFPVFPDYSCRCQPAVYDIDRDGKKEILFTNELGIYAVNHDGTNVSGWPQSWPNERTSIGFPHPVITELHNGELDDSVVVCIMDDGDIVAYKFDGSPYFYSYGGFYAAFNELSRSAFFFGGNSVSVADLNGDGFNEVVASFSASDNLSGVKIFDARIAQPAFTPNASIVDNLTVYGTVLGDLNNDKLPEIVTIGNEVDGSKKVWIKTLGTNDLPGWPITIPSANGFRGTYPVLADLDLDNIPEILLSFFEFDISSLYVFRSDGTPYVSLEGRPAGEFYSQPVTLGTPIVANVTGDIHPEIILRSGYIFPGTGNEKIHILDYLGASIDGYPINTPAKSNEVFSTPQVPLVDDIDNDGKVELLLVSENRDLLIWDFDADYSNKSRGRLFYDNLNSNIYDLSDIITDVPDDKVNLPVNFTLSQNYPNPFNPQTKINFSIDKKSEVKITIYNVLGQTVDVLLNDELLPGNYSTIFDGSDFASGVYFYRLDTESKSITKKMVLLK